MREHRDYRYKLKETFALCLSALNNWIDKKNLEYTFHRINDMIDYEDRRDFFVQQIVSFSENKLLKICFIDIKLLSIRAKKSNELANSLLQKNKKNKIRKALSIWLKISILNR